MRHVWAAVLLVLAGCGHSSGPSGPTADAREVPGGPLSHRVHATHASPAPSMFVAHLLITRTGTHDRSDAQTLCLRDEIGRAAYVRAAINKGGAVEFQAGAPVHVEYSASGGEPVRAIASNGLEAWLCGQDLEYPAGAR